MKIQIEDYRGNDLCSFSIDNIRGYDIKDFKDCNYADIDEDENGDLYIRVQLENEDLTLYSN
jgi:hypothetical protein